MNPEEMNRLYQQQRIAMLDAQQGAIGGQLRLQQQQQQLGMGDLGGPLGPLLGSQLGYPGPWPPWPVANTPYQDHCGLRALLPHMRYTRNPSVGFLWDAEIEAPDGRTARFTFAENELDLLDEDAFADICMERICESLGLKYEEGDRSAGQP